MSPRLWHARPGNSTDLADAATGCQVEGMEALVGLLLVAGAGWIAWSMLAPPVLFRVTVTHGRVRILGGLTSQSLADIEEFFRTNFCCDRNFCVTVISPTSQFESRIQITGQVSEAEKQQ